MTAAKNKNEYIHVDITTLSQYNDFVDQNGLGEYKLTIVASAPGYLDSDPSQEATFINGYPITFNVTNCTYSPSATMVAVFESTTFKFTKSTGYSLTSSISVKGVDSDKYTWTVASDGSTATLVITEPTGAVTVTVAAVQKTYDIKYGLTNLTAADSNPKTITSTATGVELTINGTTHYALPTSITVSGVATGDWSYDQATGKITLSYPTDTVTITAAGVINGIWSWNTTIPDGVWTEQAVNFTSNGRTFAGMRWDGYDLYYYVDDTGYNEFKVYSLNEETQVGTWADGGERSYWRIVNFDATEETASKIFTDYVSTNAVQSGKLATPTGVQVADDEVSWDEVENAIEYELVVNNTSWGTYTPPVYNYTFDESTGVLTLLDAPYKQNGDTVTIS